MVAALGDLTSGPVLPRLRDRMLESPEGREILKERPRINSETVDMNKLALLPEGTFGNAYITWLERCGVTPDTREPVRLSISCLIILYHFTPPDNSLPFSDDVYVDIAAMTYLRTAPGWPSSQRRIPTDRSVRCIMLTTRSSPT